MTTNDYQKSRLYAWENAIVGPLDKSSVAFDNAQAIINYIWQNEGLDNPPILLKKDVRNKIYGKANRIHMWLGDYTPTWVIIHEICHSMTTDILDDRNMGHNAQYCGVYMKVLSKYLNIDIEMLQKTATEYKVKYDITAEALMK